VSVKLAFAWSNVAGDQASVVWHVVQSVENPGACFGLATFM
jgi:hypothetical protein